jgi:SAM-dependent methyltransferase
MKLSGARPAWVRCFFPGYARAGQPQPWAVLAWAAGCAGLLGAQSGAGGAFLLAAGLGLALCAPAWGLVLLALAAPFEQPAVLGGFTLYTGEVLLALCALGAAWAWLRQRAWRRPLAPVGQWLWPWVLVLATSALLVREPAACKGALHALEFAAAIWLGVTVLRRGQEAQHVLMALVFAAAASSLWGLHQVWLGPAAQPGAPLLLLGSREVVRAGAGYGPGTLAMFLALVIPWVAVAAWMHPKSGIRLAARLGLAVLLAGWWAAFSFTGYAALGTAALVLAWVWEKARVRRLLGVLLVLVLAGLLLGLYSAWLTPAWQTKVFSWQDRLDYWALAGRLFMHSPLWGLGPGMYRQLAPLWGGGLNPAGVLMHPHSLYVTVLAELGLAGLITLVWGALQAVRYFRRCARRWAPGYEAWSGWALVAGLAGFAAANFFEHGLIHDRGVHAALFLASALVWARRPPRPGLQPRSRFAAVWPSAPPPTAAECAAVLQERQAGRAPYFALLGQALAGKGNAEVLEMGCGPAWDALALAADPALSVTGTDLARGALEQGRAAAGVLRRRVDLVPADVRRTPFADNRFDLVFSQGLLEHFPDPGPLWREMHRVLKPGGCAVVDVPQTWNPYTLARAWHQLKGDWPWGWETHYTAPDLRRAGARHGFALLAARGYGYRGGPLDATALARRRLRPLFPAGWDWLEKATGAFWMMNVVVLLQKN